MITRMLLGASLGVFVLAFVNKDAFYMTEATFVLLLAIFSYLNESK